MQMQNSCRPPLTPQNTNAEPVGFVVHKDGAKPKKNLSGMLKPGFCQQTEPTAPADAASAAPRPVDALLRDNFGEMLENNWADFKVAQGILGLSSAKRDIIKKVHDGAVKNRPSRRCRLLTTLTCALPPAG